MNNINDNYDQVTLIEKNDDINLSLNSILSRDNSAIHDNFLKKGAILFRGFAVDTNEKFDQLVAPFSDRILHYRDGGSPREKITNNIYTSTEYPKEYIITQHNELSYSHQWPSFLLFCCVKPSEEGGQTPLADCRKIYRDMPQNILTSIIEKNLKYIRNLHNGSGIGKSWKKTFETNDKYEVERFLNEGNTKVSWLADDSLRLEQSGPGILHHPITQETCWFNQPAQFHPGAMPNDIFLALKSIYGENPINYPRHVLYGDDSEIPIETINTIESIVKEHTKAFHWQKGDVMLIDNILVSHGRCSFRGERKILVSCLS